MKRIILHAGIHKTGTTAVQLFGVHQADDLRRMGIYYPRAGRPAVRALSWGHHLLPSSLKGELSDGSYWPGADRSARTVWGALADEIRSRPEETVLLSSEEFSRLSREHVQQIGELLAEFDVVPVMYFRRFDDYLQAMYATSVLFFGERRTARDYIAATRALVDYGPVVSAWRETFGRSLIVRPFHRRTLIASSILADLFAPFGYTIEAKHIKAYAEVNPSPPWNVVECARVLNRLHLSLDTKLRLWRLSTRIYPGSLPYDLAPPSYRAELIEQTFSFFQEEFGDWQDDTFWAHMRGDELAKLSASWSRLGRNRFSFVLRTVSDVVATAYGRRPARVIAAHPRAG